MQPPPLQEGNTPHPPQPGHTHAPVAVVYGQPQQQQPVYQQQPPAQHVQQQLYSPSVAQPTAVPTENTDPSEQQQESATTTPTSKPWKGASIAAVIILGISALLVIIGLATKTVMDADYSQSVFITTISVRYSFDYEDAKIEALGESATASLDEATCDHAGAVKFAAAVHYFALFTAVGAMGTIIYELVTSRVLMYASTALFSTNVGLLALHSVVLGIVRANANYSSCKTVPRGLIRYAVGPCWGWCIGAMIASFIGLIVYISSRHCKCCCYTAATQQPHQQQPVVHVVMQDYAVHHQQHPPAMMHGAPVQGQVVQAQPVVTPHHHQQPPPPNQSIL